MQRMCQGLGWWSAFLLVLVGCKPTETRIQPPPLREEYRLPPDDDARFSVPPNFPKEARTNGPQRRPTEGPTQAPPSMRGGGMGPTGGRMGGPGMGGGY